ncbi:MAG: type II toxin-antitoxin system VapC family toxin [Synergistaceae bacterium]|jgi:PIN domain nuclease of toxin-antitoxin system|nr:type II toxin-antitoxin system VapC family toxin [Synergistaceae bacterium]
MRFLIDTHVALWSLEGDERLSPGAKELLGDISTELYLSIVSVWEVAIKISIGKLNFEGGVKEFSRRIRNAGVGVLGLDDKYLECLETLPFLHRDPFDRLLIATVLTEGMTFVTADENIHRYNIKWMR